MALPPLVLGALVFFLPYTVSLGLGIRGLAAGGRDYLALARRVLPIAGFTVTQAFYSTLLALALGLPGAWFLSFPEGGTDGRGRVFPVRRLLRSLSGVPFALPSILVVLGFVLFFGNSGWVNRIGAALGPWALPPLRILYRPEAIILAHGFYNFPLVLRLAGDSLEGARKAYLPAALSLGASPLGAAFTVLLPLALPGIASAALLVFLYSFTSFAVVLVLGGGPLASTLAVEIYRYARIGMDYEAAGILALFETAIAAGVFLLYLFFERRLGSTALDRERALSVRRGPAFYVALGLYSLVIAFVALGPVLSIPLESFLRRATRAREAVLSLYWWRGIGEGALPALGRSLILAAVSASLSCFLGILSSGALLVHGGDRGSGDRGSGGRGSGRRGSGVRGSGVRGSGRRGFGVRGSGGPPLGTVVTVAAVSPLASSGIVLGLGWLILYGREGARSFLSVALVHSVIALPFVFNAISQGLKNLPPHLMDAGTVFGAGPLTRIFTLALPIASGQLRSAWAFAAAISLGELNAVMMLGMENWETLPLLIYRAAGAYRYGAACAAGTLLILCCTGLFLLSDLPRLPGPGGRPRLFPGKAGPPATGRGGVVYGA
jgi:thiamine transport system permease protein